MKSGVFVTVQVAPDRLDDFLAAMKEDVTKSRVTDYDPGCYRFDLLKDRTDPHKFIFYEAYKDDAAASFHKTTPHYNAWAEFKKSGGVLSQEVAKVETASIQGDWAFQVAELGQKTCGSGVLVTVDIQPERIDDFLTALCDDVQGSRQKALDPGCLRFDLLRDRDDPNRFYFYECYIDDDAAAFHKTTPHYNAWADFKKSGGVVNQSAVKVETASIPGGWAFQRSPSGAPVVTVGDTLMPLIGYGTYKVGVVPASASSAAAGAPPPPAGPEVCAMLVKDALTCGYTMLDCAQFYANEEWIGSALSQASIPRENVYITSKVWNNNIYKGADAVKAQVEKTISDLKCGYIDLCLVHWPVPGKHIEAFKALCECKNAGAIKAVGVSNYCVEDLDELKAAGCESPAMNQIEVNPFLFRQNTLKYFKQQGIHVQSYRGLAQGPKAWENPVIQDVCKETGRTPSQVLGRFLVQQGISHVPKASKRARIEENRDIFSFELTADQIERLSALTTDTALENFKTLYTKCIWRDTPQEGDPLPGKRTLD